MDIGATHRTQVNFCPGCGNKLDAATEVGSLDGAPTPGDWTVCIKCAIVLRFTKDLGVKRASKKELRHMPPEVEYILGKIASIPPYH